MPAARGGSTYWTTDFVGLGPFKVGQWVQGSFLEGLAFDQYVLGRPKLDKIILRYFGDANTMVANALAGTIDVANPPAENMDSALELRNRCPKSISVDLLTLGPNRRLDHRDADYASPQG